MKKPIKRSIMKPVFMPNSTGVVGPLVVKRAGNTNKKVHSPGNSRRKPVVPVL